MKVNYDTYMNKNKRRFVRLRLLLKKEPLSRRRPRDPEETTILQIMAARRWQKELETGRLLEVSPKRYRITS